MAVLGLAIAALLDTTLHKGRQVVSSALLVATLKLKLELAQHAQQESSAGLPQVLARRVWQERLVSSLPKIKVPQAAVTALLERSAATTQLSVREAANLVHTEELAHQFA